MIIECSRKFQSSSCSTKLVYCVGVYLKIVSGFHTRNSKFRKTVAVKNFLEVYDKMKMKLDFHYSIQFAVSAQILSEQRKTFNSLFFFHVSQHRVWLSLTSTNRIQSVIFLRPHMRKQKPCFWIDYDLNFLDVQTDATMTFKSIQIIEKINNIDNCEHLLRSKMLRL